MVKIRLFVGFLLEFDDISTTIMFRTRQVEEERLKRESDTDAVSWIHSYPHYNRTVQSL